MNSPKLSKDFVLRLCRLARLNVSKSTMDNMVVELDDILDLVSQLNTCQTDDTGTLESITYGHPPSWREDIAKSQNNGESLMKCAPKHDHGHYAVPKVME